MKTRLEIGHLAALLAAGYEAKVVGDEPLAGDNPMLIWFDDKLVESRPRLTSQPGVGVTGQGKTILFATVSRERAELLLEQARGLAQ